MANTLTEKLQDIFKKLKGKGKISEEDLDATLKEIKYTLLEADVSFKVVKTFIKTIKEKAIGSEVLNGLNPAQSIIKIVKDEMIHLMGDTPFELTTKNNNSITVFMMVGLQGAGKTTTASKIASKFKNKGKKPLLVACDIYRPAAIEQLRVNAKKVDVDFFKEDENNPVDIAKHAIDYAIKNNNNLVILDTAGRLQIDETLMNELKNIKVNVEVDETILAIDAMTGQEAVNVANTFNDEIGINGVILTKLDGDSRGGAALSIKSSIDVPIYYVGMGEKVSDLEQFYPDRMTSRILGMGDVLTLIDKVQEENMLSDIEKEIEEKAGLELYLESFKQMRKLGGLSSILGFMPNIKGLDMSMVDNPETDKKIKRTEAIIFSMTKEERKNPDMLNGSRKKRIADGAGVKVQDVNILLKTYEQSTVMMGQMGLPGSKNKKVKNKVKRNKYGKKFF